MPNASQHAQQSRKVILKEEMNMASTFTTKADTRPVAPCTKAAPPPKTNVALNLDAPFFWMKRIADRGLALLLLIPVLPLIGLLIIAVRLTSKGPGIYSQLRVGHCGRVFTLYKIRSMGSDAESSLGPTWAGVDGDSRVTRIG